MIRLDTHKVQVEMARRCMSNKELADRINWFPGDLLKVLSGKRKAKIKTIGLIAKALDVDVEDIITEE